MLVYYADVMGDVTSTGAIEIISQKSLNCKK